MTSSDIEAFLDLATDEELLGLKSKLMGKIVGKNERYTSLSVAGGSSQKAELVETSLLIPALTRALKKRFPSQFGALPARTTVARFC